MNRSFWVKFISQASDKPNRVNWLVEPIGSIFLLWQNLWHKAAELSALRQFWCTRCCRAMSTSHEIATGADWAKGSHPDKLIMHQNCRRAELSGNPQQGALSPV